MRECTMESLQKKVGKRALKEQARQCSQRIKDKIQSYFKYETKLPKSEERTGQLKFYTDNLLVRNLAVSTRVEFRSPKNKIFHYIDDTILQIKDNPQQVIDFLDIRKNIEAYNNSIYHKLSDSLLEKACEMESFSMFLLLERVQQVVESEFLAYMNTPQVTEEEELRFLESVKEIEEEESENEPPTEKQKQYLPFLNSLAIYEILIWEYFEERYDYFFKQKEEDETEDVLASSQGRSINDKERLYALIHLQNLFAMMRVVHTIETVQCNTGWLNPKTKEGKYASMYASVCRQKMEQLELFCAASDVFRERDKNLYVLFKELNEMNFGKFVSIEEMIKEIRQTKEKIEEYIKYIEYKHENKLVDLSREKQKEKFDEWFRVVVWLANAIFETTGSIFDIYSNVKSKKIKE